MGPLAKKEILLLDKNSFLLPEAVKIARLPNFPLLVFSAVIYFQKKISIEI